MSDIININRETKAVNEDGKILERFFAWMVSVTDSLNLLLTNTGSGSPEGSLSAPVGSWYVDTSAAPGCDPSGAAARCARAGTPG